MIQAIGIVVCAYVCTRMLKMICDLDGAGKFKQMVLFISGAITILIAVGSFFAILTSAR